MTSNHTKIELRVKHASSSSANGPILASFSQGEPPRGCLHPEDTNARDYGLGPIQFEYSKNIKRKNQRILSAENKRFRYSASSSGGNTTRGLVKYAVGVFNRKKGKLELYEADHVFKLQQQMLGQTHERDQLSELSQADRHKLLIETFGSKLKKQQQRSREANQIDIDNVSGSKALSAMFQRGQPVASSNSDVQGTSVSSDAAELATEEAQMQTRRQYLPPFNLSATTPADAYPIDQLINPDEGKGLMESVNEMLKLLRKDDASSTIQYSRRYKDFVKSELMALADNTDAHADKRRIKAKIRVLLYLDALLRLYHAPTALRPSQKVVDKANGEVQIGEENQNGQEQQERQEPQEEQENVQEGDRLTMQHATAVPALSWLSELLASALLAKYTTKESDGDKFKYSRSRLQQDRLVMHICCATLHARDYLLDIKPLATELKLATKKLSGYFKELGCTTGSGGKLRLVTPLEFPKSRKKRASKK